MKKLLLVDGNAMLFRAFYATAYGRMMTSKAGVPTNAVFGFASMIQKAIDTVEPDSILVAFDAGKHTFRHDLYPDYKGGRKETPEELIPQFQLVRDYLDAYGIKWVERKDIEADDLIGTMSKQSDDYDTVILSSDHDLLQLVDDGTTVLLMKKGITEMEEMTPTKMKEEMGIVPIQIIDMKGLMGDKSDNIPGIAGIGEKTALKLLQEYDNVENVLDHVDDLKGALQKKVMAGKEDALLSKQLATIKRDVEMDFTADDCTFTPNYQSLVTFLHSLDMNAMARKYEEMVGDAPVVEKKPDVEARIVQSLPESFYEDDFALFVDDTKDHYLHADIHGFAFAKDDDLVFMHLEDVKKDEKLLSYLANPSHKVIGFDIKRNLHLWKKYQLNIKESDDAMIIACLCDSTVTSIDKIFAKYNLVSSIKYEDVYGKANSPILMVDEDLQCKYACENARFILEIYQEALPILKEYELESLYQDMELPLTSILFEMEEDGIRCDIEILDKIAQETYAKIESEQNEIYQLVGKEFNINSPKQLGEVLFDDLGLSTGKKRSTGAEVLEKLIDDHPVITHILNYRKLSKIYSTYAEGLKKYIQADGKIHTIYNQCATQTGRLSSSEPNLQNISVRDELGKEIRKAFIPEDNHVLISSDYHQIELRMLAHMANEDSLIDAFNHEIDIHTKTAMDVFDVKEEEVTPLMRRQAKTVNFGIVYGMSDFGLAQELQVTRKEANAFIEKYYEKYPKIQTYMNDLIAYCEKHGYVKTLCNRRREIPEIHDKNRMVRDFGKRAAMNAPIQGSAADLIKIAMIHIHQMMQEANVKSRMILQVHDELIFDVYEDEIEQMKELINDGMIHAMTLKVPLTAECAVGKDWYEAK